MSPSAQIRNRLGLPRRHLQHSHIHDRVPTTGCSVKATTTTSFHTAVIPTAPLTISPVSCYPESAFPSAVSGSWDIEPAEWGYIGYACADGANEEIGPGSVPITFSTITNGVPYYFSVAWIDGCYTTVPGQNVYQPWPWTVRFLIALVFSRETIIIVSVSRS